MALVGTLTTPDGIEHTGAYLKISCVSYYKDKMVIHYDIYHNQETRLQELNQIESESEVCKSNDFISYDIKNIKTNPIQAGYLYLKEKKFNNWIDA